MSSTEQEDQAQFMTFEEWLNKASLDEDPDVVKIDYLAAKAEWELHRFEERKRQEAGADRRRRGTEVVGKKNPAAIRQSKPGGAKMASLLWLVVVILAVFWAIGFFVANLGDVIHILLILAVIALLYNLFVGSRSTAV